MNNNTNIEEFQELIPLISFGAFISILFFCCVCKKKRLSHTRELNNQRYQSLHNDNDIDNNYNNQNNQRTFPKIMFNSNTEQPPPYQQNTN